jgi:hypothetical protein
MPQGYQQNQHTSNQEDPTKQLFHSALRFVEKPAASFDL